MGTIGKTNAMHIFLIILALSIPSKSPTKAVLLSAAIPGGGQFYTHSYIKGILIACGEVYFGAYTISDYINYKKSNEQYIQDYYKRETFSDGMYFLGIFLFSLADAYVDAHLYKFSEKTGFKFRLEPPKIKEK